jgi:hypothetical protein
MISWNTRLPDADSHERPIDGLRGLIVGRVTDSPGELDQLSGLLVRAPVRREPRGLDKQQPPRLEQRPPDARIYSSERPERLEPSVAPPVPDPGRVPMPHLDQPQLLEPLQRLADRCLVDLELSGERALRR